jgi:major vault protein
VGNKRSYLTELEYCHVINNLTGKIHLIEGPYRLKWNIGVFKSLYGSVKKKIILKEGEYAIVLNPYNGKKKEVAYGDREVRVGPLICALHLGETLETHEECFNHNENMGNACNGIHNVHVLTNNEGLKIRAIQDYMDGDISRKSGDEWVVIGPCRYIPVNNCEIILKFNSISLADYEGVYIKNRITGKITLKQGPANVILTENEELWEKQYTRSELSALMFLNDFDLTRARPLWVLENEIALIMSEESRYVVNGPKVIMLEPLERPYIMKISAGTPKKTESLKIWKIKLGPAFSTDLLDVRTKDNAVLQIKLRYKWRFKQDPNDDFKVFEVSDFIGLATETMASIIRDEAAKHDFEIFHSGASEIIKGAILGFDSSTKEYGYFQFRENGFEIFDIDIKEIVPKNSEIADQLNDAIKSNMQVYVDKLNQKAKLEAEREEIERRKEIESKRQELIQIEQDNLEMQEIGKAKIQAQTIIEISTAEAKAIKLKKEAEISADIEEMKRKLELLKENNSDEYLRMTEIEYLGSIEKMIIPTNARLFTHLGKNFPIVDETD